MSQFNFYITLVFLLFASGIIKGEETPGPPICTDPMGACATTADCNQKCAEAYPGGEGDCFLGLCNCSYKCGLGPVPPAPGPKRCNTNFGECNNSCPGSCCNTKCQQKWGSSATGSCQNIIGTVSTLCLCVYDCRLL